jgi:hypothetical protein
MTILNTAVSAEDPVKFLCDFGVMIFHNCCAFNLSVLTKNISSSRSRIVSALRREGWRACGKDIHQVKPRMKYVNANELKYWSIREYPADSGLAAFVRDHPHLWAAEDIVYTAMRDVVELTLQKDIFSWTSCFDD